MDTAIETESKALKTTNSSYFTEPKNIIASTWLHKFHLTVDWFVFGSKGCLLLLILLLISAMHSQN